MLIVLDLPFKMPCRGRDVVYNQLLLTQTIPQLSKCCPFTPLSCCLWEELLLAPAVVQMPFHRLLSTLPKQAAIPSQWPGLHLVLCNSLGLWCQQHPPGSKGNIASLLGNTLDLPPWCSEGPNQSWLINYRKWDMVHTVAWPLCSKRSTSTSFLMSLPRPRAHVGWDGMAESDVLHLWPELPACPSCP